MTGVFGQARLCRALRTGPFRIHGGVQESPKNTAAALNVMAVGGAAVSLACCKHCSGTVRGLGDEITGIVNLVRCGSGNGPYGCSFLSQQGLMPCGET